MAKNCAVRGNNIVFESFLILKWPNVFSGGLAVVIHCQCFSSAIHLLIAQFMIKLNATNGAFSHSEALNLIYFVNHDRTIKVTINLSYECI